MEPVLRAPANDEENSRVWEMIVRSFNFPAEHVDRFLTDPDTPQGLAVFMGDEIAAYSRIKSFAMFFGGRSVPTGGYSPVGAAPEFRGRGFASMVTAGQYPLMRERGEVLGALYPATTRLYRGVGFEVAGVWSLAKLPTRSFHALRPAGAVHIRRAGLDDLDEIKGLYRAWAVRRDGHLDRPDWWWEKAFVKEFEKLHVYLVPGEGYITFRHQPDKEWGYTVQVHEVVAVDVEVATALWRMVGSSSSMSRQTIVNGPPEHPLLLLLPEQDLQHDMSLRIMLRLVDMAGAFAARGYPVGARAAVEFEVEDKHCDWNTGRWRLVVEDGEGRLEKGVGAGPVMRASVNGLASLYSGYATAWTLAECGLLSGASEADLAALTAVFAGPTPWMPDFF
jgi:predicted acetyltransferase